MQEIKEENKYHAQKEIIKGLLKHHSFLLDKKQHTRKTKLNRHKKKKEGRNQNKMAVSHEKKDNFDRKKTGEKKN